MRAAAGPHLEHQFAAQLRRAFTQAAQAVASLTRSRLHPKTLSVVSRCERDVIIGGAHGQPYLFGRSVALGVGERFLRGAVERQPVRFGQGGKRARKIKMNGEAGAVLKGLRELS